MSIREKSDKKTKKDFSDAGEAIMKLLESKTFKDAIAKAMELQAQQASVKVEEIETETE